MLIEDGGHTERLKTLGHDGNESIRCQIIEYQYQTHLSEEEKKEDPGSD